MFSKLDRVLKEKVEVSSEKDSLKTQLDLVLKENEILKNKNECDVVLKKNDILSSKFEFVLKENDSLKNIIVLISKELECMILIPIFVMLPLVQLLVLRMHASHLLILKMIFVF